MSTNVPKWDSEREATLVNLVGNESPVSAETVKRAAEELETTTRSVSSKLRKMGHVVESLSKEVGKKFTPAEEEELRAFVESNPKQHTYAEIAALVLDGKYSAKRIQGKILSMELTDMVKPTPKVEVAKKYSEAEEAKIKKLVLAGEYLEDIANALGKEVNSIRGKILSMSTADPTIVIPRQRTYKSKDTVDPIEALGDSITEMTVEEVAEKVGKTVRGVKTMLTRRGIKVKNYDGAKKHEKIESAKVA